VLPRLARALDETIVTGIQTTLPFHRFVARHAGFASGDVSIDWVADEWASAVEADRATALEAASWAAAAATAESSRRQVPGADAGRRTSWATEGRARAVDRWPR
jgi:acetyl/propionyl-CoA carboxylase alpha subunit